MTICHEPLAISHDPVTRRAFLSAAALLPSAAFLHQTRSGARFIRNLPLGAAGGGGAPPFGRLLGSGLDARLFTDLSIIAADKPETLVTPTDRFYVRTAASRQPPSPTNTGTEVESVTPPSLVARGTEVAGIDFARLERTRVRVGPYLMECAGNSDPSNFGLISTAAWGGVPMPAILDQLGAPAGRPRVLVEGVDPPGPSATSVPGASWIFSRDQLDRAILANEMNGAPLTPDHGGPAMRLVVPGWYGCVCIKWVKRIELVANDEQATSQMREFAARTHQAGVPTLARDYMPAVIDTAAMPVGVEQWTDAGRAFYRIVGIIWGGAKPTNALSIRFKSGEPWIRVDDCPLPASTLTWSMWSHTWRPTAAGRYQIVLRVDDPAIRTRRLDLFFYVREVAIDEI